MRVELEESQEDVEGVWKNFNENVRFRIARAGNKRFLRASDKHEAPHRKQLVRNKLGTEKQIEIHCRAMAEGMLLDWEGLEGPDGNLLPYSTETAFKVLRYNPSIRDFVFEVATDEENFRKEEIDETAKKSPDISGGENAGA